jgi:hypothetical protein
VFIIAGIFGPLVFRSKYCGIFIQVGSSSFSSFLSNFTSQHLLLSVPLHFSLHITLGYQVYLFSIVFFPT